MKYLDAMTDEELVETAKKNNIFMDLKYIREKLIEKLESIGFERRKKEVLKSEETNTEIKEVKEVEEIEETVEIDFAALGDFRYRSRSYYRNYPNKKLMRKLKKRYRFRNEKIEDITYGYKGINSETIRRRRTETEINRSKFLKGAEYEGVSKPEDKYFDKAPLPNSYFVDEIVLMPKNPTTLYMYWEIREDTYERLKENNNVQNNVVIKLFKHNEEYRKIIRDSRMGSYYITNIDTNQEYEATIGYEDMYGNYSEVAHSKIATSPSNKVSDNFDLTWGTVREDKNTNQIIKYVNSPMPTEQNMEFIEILNDENFARTNDEFSGSVIRKLIKVGSSGEMILTEKQEGIGLDLFGSSSFSGSSFGGSSFTGSSFQGSSDLNK